MSAASLQAEPSPIRACTISRDLEAFDLLIEDMEAELGEAWGDLSFAEAVRFFGQPDAEALEFVAIAVDSEDEDDLDRVGTIVSAARERGIHVILVAEEVSPIALHRLLRLGAEDFVPYPLPDGALHSSIERLRTPKSTAVAVAAPSRATGGDHSAIVLPVQGLAGGTGSSTFAVNLAWELAALKTPEPQRVCLLDLDLQQGSVSTYLDLARREAVFELLSDAQSADAEAFHASLLPYDEKLRVLTAPPEMVPLDIVGPEQIGRVLELARTSFDYVVVDMPSTLVEWTETVLSEAHLYFAMLELDMRSAQNALRLIRALKAEELPHEKLRWVLNRAPKFTDLSARARVKRMAESLDIKLELMMPDGGKPVSQACDHGQTLGQNAPKNPLRREIAKLAAQIHDRNVADAEAA